MIYEFSARQIEIALRCLFEAFGAVEHPEWKGPASVNRQLVVSLRSRLEQHAESNPMDRFDLIGFEMTKEEVYLVIQSIDVAIDRLGPDEFETVTGLNLEVVQNFRDTLHQYSR